MHEDMWLMRGREAMRSLDCSALMMMMVMEVTPTHRWGWAYNFKATLQGNAADGDEPGCGRTL